MTSTKMEREWLFEGMCVYDRQREDRVYFMTSERLVKGLLGHWGIWFMLLSGVICTKMRRLTRDRLQKEMMLQN